MRVVIVALVLLALLGTSRTADASWTGCSLRVDIESVRPEANLYPPSPTMETATAHATCATPRVRTLQVCLLSAMAAFHGYDPACVVSPLTTRRATLSVQCPTRDAIGDEWTAWAWLWDPLTGSQAVSSATWVGDVSEICSHARKGVAAMS